MATVVSWNGTSYTVPAIGERTWAGTARVDGLLVALATYGLQRSGGSFTLSGDVDWGNVAGHVAKWYKSNTANVATTGVVRFANNEGIAWRNAANGANLLLKVNASDALEFDGSVVRSGTVGPTVGGTGLTTYTLGDIVYASAANTLAKLAGNTTTTKKFLRQTGDGALSAAPAWDTLVVGDLPTVSVAKGGTGITSYNTGEMLYTSAATTFARLALGGGGTFMKSTGSAPSWATLTSGDVTCSATNDSGAAGFLGELISSTVTSGSALSLSTGTAANLTSISLTAGDWDVSVSAAFNTAATTTLTQLTAAAATTSATLPASPGYPASNENRSQHNFASFTPGTTAHSVVVPTYRVSLSATTTIYLVVRGAFAASTLTAQGYIQARRVR